MEASARERWVMMSFPVDLAVINLTPASRLCHVVETRCSGTEEASHSEAPEPREATHAA